MRTSVKNTKRKRNSAPAAIAAAEPAVAEAAVAPAASVGAPEAVAPVVVQTAGASQASVVKLPSVCTVKDAANLKDAFCKVLEEAASVTLDIRAVERVDTAIFQLLYAFVRDRAARNLGVTWLGAPSALIDAATLLGLHAQLNLPEKESLGVAA
jgi:ABC-type transporter Mla MlaB component